MSKRRFFCNFVHRKPSDLVGSISGTRRHLGLILVILVTVNLERTIWRRIHFCQLNSSRCCVAAWPFRFATSTPGRLDSSEKSTEQPGAPSSFLLLVAMPFAPSSFLLLVASLLLLFSFSMFCSCCLLVRLYCLSSCSPSAGVQLGRASEPYVRLSSFLSICCPLLVLLPAGRCREPVSTLSFCCMFFVSFCPFFFLLLSFSSPLVVLFLSSLCPLLVPLLSFCSCLDDSVAVCRHDSVKAGARSTPNPEGSSKGSTT